MNPNTVDILLIEDNMQDAEMTIRELKKFHLVNNLIHLTDGAEALDFLFAEGKYAGVRDIMHPPKLILLDIHMPKINGIEVLRKLKSDIRTKSTPVVMLTTSKENPDIIDCYRLGVNSYIIKPVNFERFAIAINNLGLYWMLLNQEPVKLR